MKKIIMAICLSLAAFWSIGAMAEDIGVINMQTVFKSSPKAQAINAALKNQFSARKATIVKMGQQLQADIKNYQKNQAVLSKPKLAELQKKISQQSVALRQSQAKFQSDLMAAQNQKMSGFLNQVKAATAQVATKKNLELVLPINVVIYAKDKLDITSDVLTAMK